MRLARAGAGHAPAHARSPRCAHRPEADRRRSRDTRSRWQKWTPVLVIAVIYVVAVGLNEWRLQRHVEELRDRSPAVEIVVDDADGQLVGAAD